MKHGGDGLRFLVTFGQAAVRPARTPLTRTRVPRVILRPRDPALALLKRLRWPMPACDSASPLGPRRTRRSPSATCRGPFEFRRVTSCTCLDRHAGKDLAAQDLTSPGRIRVDRSSPDK